MSFQLVLNFPRLMNAKFSVCEGKIFNFKRISNSIRMPLRDLHSISVWLKIALACSSLGVIFFIVGFATNSWMVQSYLYYNKWQTRGLWKFKSCTGHTCQLSSYNSYYLQDFHKATQAMECIGLIALLLAFLLLVLFIFVDACRRREAILSTIFFLFAAGAIPPKSLLH